MLLDSFTKLQIFKEFVMFLLSIRFRISCNGISETILQLKIVKLRPKNV